jgi:hypothetical protein
VTENLNSLFAYAQKLMDIGIAIIADAKIEVPDTVAIGCMWLVCE